MTIKCGQVDETVTFLNRNEHHSVGSHTHIGHSVHKFGAIDRCNRDWGTNKIG